MIASKFSLQMDPKPLAQAVDKGMYKSFSHAAASLRKEAQAKFVKRPRIVATKKAAKGKGKRRKRRGHTLASPVGSAPFTRKGDYPRAITYDASKTGAVIGPRHSRLGTAGEAHEHEGEKTYKGQRFPSRPTMGPTLSENLSRIPKSFAGSVG